MNRKTKKIIIVVLHILFLIITSLFIYLVYKYQFFVDNEKYFVVSMVSYIAISILFMIIYLRISYEFRKEKEIKRASNIDFSKVNKTLSETFLRQTLISNKYQMIDENKFIQKIDHNLGEPTWTDYYYITLINLNVIDKHYLDVLHESSKKGITTYSLVLILIDYLDNESKTIALEYIKLCLIEYRASYLKNLKGYSLMIYEKDTSTLYYYNDKSFFHRRYKNSNLQLLKLL